MTVVHLPADVATAYTETKSKIQQRLRDFAAVPKSSWFYEFCFCLCTPQSKAEHAMIVVEGLTSRDFLTSEFDPVYLLADKRHYIRFHNVKARRLLALRRQWPTLVQAMDRLDNARQLRELLVDSVDGFGLKEASHVLRNIGYRDLAILDRHILRMLLYCGVLQECHKVSTQSGYLQVETLALDYSKNVGIPLDELDLLFWFMNTGKILK